MTKRKVAEPEHMQVEVVRYQPGLGNRNFWRVNVDGRFVCNLWARNKRWYAQVHASREGSRIYAAETALAAIRDCFQQNDIALLDADGIDIAGDLALM